MLESDKGACIPPPGASHVIEWSHPDIVPGCSAGMWFLQPREKFLDTSLKEREAEFREAVIDADVAELTAWAAGELGCAVRLIREDGSVTASSLPGARTLTQGATRAGRLLTRVVSRRELPWRLYWVTPQAAELPRAPAVTMASMPDKSGVPVP